MDIISIPTQYAGVIVEGNIVLPFVNHIDDETGDTGSLELSKTVIGEDIDEDKEFIFTITFDNIPGDSMSIVVDGELVVVTSTNNQIEVILKHGESIIIDDIPSGVKYKIEEKEDSDYISSLVDVEGSIVSNINIPVPFVNQIREEEKETSLKVTKVVEAEDIDLDVEFNFVLEVTGREPISFTLKHGESKTFDNLPIGATYILSEVGIPNGYALTNVVYGQGTLLEINNLVEFTNTFVNRVMIDIEGTKYWDTKGYNPTLPESITLHLKNGETVIQTVVVTPDEHGDWNYTFNVPKYDNENNEIIYLIEEEKIDGWNSQVDAPDITNTYIIPITIDSIMIRKEITGEEPSINTMFQFKLQGLDNAPMPEGTDTSNNSKIIDIVGTGTNTFGDITYVKAGTYVYNISELHTGEEGYTYDTSMYQLVVKVEEVDGVLEMTSKVITKDEVACSQALFTNEYSSIPKKEDEKVVISGIKKWEHGNLDPAYYPTEITVVVKNGEDIVLRRKITEADQWRWSFILDKYDAEKNEIHYTIDELPVYGYNKEIFGTYSIKNTYDSNSGLGTNGGSNTGNTQTSDAMKLELWSILLLASGASILIVIKYYRKNKS
ncbi:MAG: Cna B-type domain-containing protein [Coprobacillaceae bacterium]